MKRALEGAAGGARRALDLAGQAPLLALAAVVGCAGALLAAGFVLGAVLPLYEIKQSVLGKLEGLRAPPKAADARRFPWSPLSTALHELEVVKIPIGTFGGGGGVEQVGDTVVFSTPVGLIGYLTPDNALRYTDLRVPMRYDELVASDVFAMPTFHRDWFRVLDLLVVPRDARTVDLYVSHHRFMDDCVAVALSRIALTREGDGVTGDLDGWETVFTAEPCVPFYMEGIEVFSGQVGGGALARLSDATLLMTTGDHAFDGVHTPGASYAQDPASDLGKALLIDTRTGEAEVYASGLRNPQGLLLSEDGAIWVTDHGPRGGDEINRLERGVDYGWPTVTLGETYEGAPWPFNPRPGRHAGYREPVHAFVPSIGLSNIAEIRGGELPLWEGDFLVATLVHRTLYRLRREGDGFQYAEPIPIGEKVRDLFVRADGVIVMLSDDGDLMVMRNAESERPGDPVRVTGLAVLPEIEAATYAGWRSADTPEGRGHVVFARTCQSCHLLVEANSVGPHLKGLIGREVGAVAGFPYSPALASSGARWSARSLRRYLEDPPAAFPGTTMAAPGLSDADMSDLIAYLSSVD